MMSGTPSAMFSAAMLPGDRLKLAADLLNMARSAMARSDYLTPAAELALVIAREEMDRARLDYPQKPQVSP